MAEKVERLRIYFVTWNVATTYPGQDLHRLLGISPDDSPRQLPDLYFVGLQEVKAQPQNVIIGMLFEDPWTKSFRDVLKEYDYVKVCSQRLQGLILNGFCLRKHITHLRSVEAQFTRTGFHGLWGNKGAVSIRLNIYGVSICIVNTHLTPHDHLLENRIADYNSILERHTFDTPDTSNILFHDYIFWIGDLNFRLHGDDLSATAIDLMVKQNQLEPLMCRDQLKMVMKSGDAFAELNENPFTFPPTYKYEFGSQTEFDLKRRPSWTDRILYKVNADVYDNIKLAAVQLNYKSHSYYVQSDHKPVTGEFDIVVRSGVPDHCVEFRPVSEWFLNEENFVSYKLLGDVRSASTDWVGIFPNEFSSLDEYLVYEYVGQGKAASDPCDPDATTERIYFNNMAIRSLGMYRLVYVAQRGNLIGILGVSPPFPGQHRPLTQSVAAAAQ